jgi:hypothetical protein
LAITSAGFDGTVDEVQAAKMARFAGSEYAVLAAGSMKVAPVTTADRTVAVWGGTAFGHGVLSESDTTVNLQAAAVSSGSRWDTVVLRRDWQPPGGTASLMLLQGTSSKLVASTRKVGPGVLDDQLLALVRFQAGQTLPQEIVDLRCWPSKVVAANDLAALTTAQLGTEAVVGGVRYRRELDASQNLAWIPDRTNVSAGLVAEEKISTAAIDFEAGWTFAAGYTTRVLRIGNFVQLDLSIRRSGAEVNPGATLTIGQIPAGFRPDTPTPFPMVYYSANGTYGGVLQVYDNSGNINTVSGYPGETINRRSTSTDISIRAQAFYMVKTANVPQTGPTNVGTN